MGGGGGLANRGEIKYGNDIYTEIIYIYKISSNI